MDSSAGATIATISDPAAENTIQQDAYQVSSGYVKDLLGSL